MSNKLQKRTAMIEYFFFNYGTLHMSKAATVTKRELIRATKQLEKLIKTNIKDIKVLQKQVEKHSKQTAKLKPTTKLKTKAKATPKATRKQKPNQLKQEKSENNTINTSDLVL